MSERRRPPWWKRPWVLAIVGLAVTVVMTLPSFVKDLTDLMDRFAERITSVSSSASGLVGDRPITSGVIALGSVFFLFTCWRARRRPSPIVVRTALRQYLEPDQLKAAEAVPLYPDAVRYNFNMLDFTVKDLAASLGISQFKTRALIENTRLIPKEPIRKKLEHCLMLPRGAFRKHKPYDAATVRRRLQRYYGNRFLRDLFTWEEIDDASDETRSAILARVEEHRKLELAKSGGGR